MKKSKVFVETSVQIRRLLGGTEKRRQIEALLADRYVITSMYVFMEFRRTILQDFSLLRSVVQQIDREGIERISVGDILRKIGNVRTVLSSRIEQHCLIKIVLT